MIDVQQRLETAENLALEAAESIEGGLSKLHEAIGVISDDEPALGPRLVAYRSAARHVEEAAELIASLA